MAAVPVFFIIYLATWWQTLYREYFATVEGRAGNSDKGAGKNSDALPSEGNNADIHVDEACTLECLSRHTNTLST